MAKIIDAARNGTLVIPVDKDGFLSYAVLKQYFANAIGLEYTNGEEKTAVLFDHTLAVLLPPDGGWSNKIFSVRSASCSSTPANEAEASAPYIPVNVDRLISGIENYLFFEEVGEVKCCFTVMSTHYAITFNHGHHKDWVDKTTVIICNQAGQKFEVRVVESDAEVDFVIVRSEVALVHKPPVIGIPRTMERYILLGYPNSDMNYQALEGVFSSIERDAEGRLRGSSGSRRGFSGGPIFNYRGELLGINVANDSSVKFVGFNGSTTMNELNEMNATFPFLSVIVPAYYLAAKYHKDCRFKR